MADKSRVPKTAPSRIKVAERRAEALKMRKDGIAPVIICATLGYRSTAAFYQDISRALASCVGEPAAEVRALEVARMDDALVRFNEMECKVRAVRDREHITVNNGRVITVRDKATGEEVPLIDDEPVLRATAQLLAIEGKRGDVQARRAKLLGLDAPTKVSVITDEALDDELARTAAEVAELERAAADEAAGTPEPEGEEGGAPEAD
jgi:hypothetical protein